MRKFIAVLLCAITAFAATSCSDALVSTKKEYTVTFLQNGKQIGEIKVVDGVYSDTVPVISPKTGYDLKWSKTDFSDITSDITVTVLETPKTYSVTLDPNGGSFDDETTDNKILSVTYDIDYVLPDCVKDGYKFVAWTINENTSCPSTGKWTYDENPTLTAAYEEIHTEKFKVRFVQEGYDDIVIEVLSGERLTIIPSPREVKGYNVSWDADDLLGRVIDGHLTVNATKAPKSYTVVFKYNNTQTRLTATYNEKFSFPEVDGVESWCIDGSMADYSGEISHWDFDCDVTFTAKYIGEVKVTINVDKNKDIPKIKTEFIVPKGTDIGKLLEFPDAGDNYNESVIGYSAIVDGKKVEIKKGDSFVVFFDTELTVLTRTVWIGPF